MPETEAVRLTPRLTAIAAEIAPGARLADVGTDHAHLPIFLVQQGQIAHAVASDLREGPLARARQNTALYRCQDRVTLRLGAGLAEVQPDECDTISIAGMGGETIIAILQDAAWTARGDHVLLLQPMTMTSALRQWLWRSGYDIERESLCQEEHRHYVVLRVRGGAAPRTLPLGACCVSPALLKATGVADYLTHVLRRETRALDGLRQARDANAAQLAQQELTVITLKQGLEELL